MESCLGSRSGSPDSESAICGHVAPVYPRTDHCIVHLNSLLPLYLLDVHYSGLGLGLMKLRPPILVSSCRIRARA